MSTNEQEIVIRLELITNGTCITYYSKATSDTLSKLKINEKNIMKYIRFGNIDNKVLDNVFSVLRTHNHYKFSIKNNCRLFEGENSKYFKFQIFGTIIDSVSFDQLLRTFIILPKLLNLNG